MPPATRLLPTQKNISRKETNMLSAADPNRLKLTDTFGVRNTVGSLEILVVQILTDLRFFLVIDGVLVFSRLKWVFENDQNHRLHTPGVKKLSICMAATV
jgi:hypothetical protein